LNSKKQKKQNVPPFTQVTPSGGSKYLREKTPMAGLQNRFIFSKLLRIDQVLWTKKEKKKKKKKEKKKNNGQAPNDIQDWKGRNRWRRRKYLTHVNRVGDRRVVL
jgi:hypothetical protein